MDYIEQEMPKKGDTVLVGMSGGVDSTLVALLLLKKGCKVIGVTMSLWDGQIPQIKAQNPQKTIKESCYGPNELKNIEECKKFCAEHNIEYHVIDVKEKYRQEVLEYFKSEYRNGRTPNPCVMCNRKIKFGAMLQGIQDLGIEYDYFCTGHYAKIVKPSEGLFGTDKKPCMISAASDVSKDQTYFIYRVPSSTLEKVRFPLANTKKSDVLKLAKDLDLEAANRAESQDFLGEEYFDMIFSDKPSIPGDIIDLDGKVLGKHRGIEHYTVGQRRGLGVAVNYPVYVHSIDAKNNLVVLAPNDALNSSGLIADDFVWPADVEPTEPIQALVKIRLASKPVECTIERYTPTPDQTFVGTPWKITFQTPQRAVAPGQSAVLLKDGVIIGGGIISCVLD
ncbi:MAG: tRNA 2-thiouridine(34) synthase MnmA [Treponema sp.]|jgi:tRNA-specific 2-thiouridylase|nr:tRNA 2-thiouridine(34) synthase MnmA [Treponema sp.]